MRRRRKVEEAEVLFGSGIISSEPDLWLPLTPVLMKGKGSGCTNMAQHEVQGLRSGHRAVPEVAVPSPCWGWMCP